MGKGFLILRSLLFVFITSVVLAFVPIAYGDIKMGLVVGSVTFCLSILIALVLIQIIRRE